MKRIPLLVTAALTTVALALAGCGLNRDPLAEETGAARDDGTIMVGSANFPENVLLAELYAGALRAKGVNVSTRLSIGSREVYLEALRDGSIDLIPEYTGNLARYYDQQADISTPQAALAAAARGIPRSMELLTPAPAEDKDAVVVTRATATRYSLSSIPDLARVSGQFVLGAPPEFKERVDGLPGLRRVYGLTFREFRALDAGGPLSVQALKNGQVQVANLFTTDPQIPANDLVVLTDPERLFGAQQIVPLIATASASDEVRAALNELSARIDTATLTGLVGKVALENQDAAAVARDWLGSQGLS